jgi:putative NADH-flavin reductase
MVAYLHEFNNRKKSGMNLLLLGATGLTGKELLAQALDQGHAVTALVRSPENVDAKGERLDIRVGSVTDPTAVQEALAGQDAVLSALGARGLRELFGVDLITRSMQAIVSAMERNGVRRLIFMSALGVGESAPDAPAVFRVVMRTALRQIAKDKAAAENELRRSNLDWTLVYPPSLTMGPRTRGYRAGSHLRLKATAKISRADVADFMLRQVEDTTFSRTQAIIGY